MAIAAANRERRLWLDKSKKCSAKFRIRTIHTSSESGNGDLSLPSKLVNTAVTINGSIMFFRLRAMGHTMSMNIFLKQEIDQIQIVIKLVHETLKDLLLAIDGIIIMNDVILHS